MVIYALKTIMCDHIESRFLQMCWIRIGVRAVTAPKQKHASEFATRVPLNTNVRITAANTECRFITVGDAAGTVLSRYVRAACVSQVL